MEEKEINTVCRSQRECDLAAIWKEQTGPARRSRCREKAADRCCAQIFKSTLQTESMVSNCFMLPWVPTG